jgi:hypothetical protein
MFSLQFSRLHRVVMLLVIFHIHLKDLRRPTLNVSNENDLILFPCFTVFKSLHEPDCGLEFSTGKNMKPCLTQLLNLSFKLWVLTHKSFAASESFLVAIG